MNSELFEKTAETISHYDMIRPGERIVVAVSGGADSVALLNVLLKLKDKLKADILAAHVNHMIRGEEADRDEKFVEDLCAKLGLKLVVEEIDVPSLSRELKIGVEEAARKARYEFLERVRAQCCADKIATAHTADDQAETVLLNIFRGSGLDGISGIPVVRETIIRPLIKATRQEIESYLAENGLSWQTDSTNLSVDYTRNRVRLRLIPLIEADYNPNVRKALISLSRLAKDEADAINDIADQAFSDAITEECRDHVVFDAKVLQKSPRAIVRRCLRKAIRLVKGDLVDVEFEQVERIVAWMELGNHFTLTLPSGMVYADLKNEKLKIFTKQQLGAVAFSQRVAIPGRTEIPEIGMEMITRIVSPVSRPKNKMQAVIDPSKLKGDLIARTWEKGDKIRPLGMAGRKKLQDVFVDLKIPAADRAKLPVLADDEKLVWVAGAVVSEDVKVTEKTAAALWVECLPIESWP